MPSCKHRKEDASQKLFLMTTSTQKSILSCRCTKHDNQCEQHKPPLQRPSQKVAWSGGRPKGFQSFHAPKGMCLGTLSCFKASPTPLPHPHS